MNTIDQDVMNRHKHDSQAVQALKNGEYVRIAALSHDIPWKENIKVIFHNIHGKEYAYWMSQETYDAYPTGECVTLAQYETIGSVLPSKNIDIYSNDPEYYQKHNA